jgi:hypothetical protein
MFFWNVVSLYARSNNSWTVRRILFIFDIQEFIDHGSVLGECEISSSKNKRPSQVPPPPQKKKKQHEIAIFSKIGETTSNKFQRIMVFMC